MRHGLILSFILTTLFSGNKSFSQSTIVPPSPNAMKMTEYFGQRPNMYTGTANVSVPLYTIDFDGWKLPLSISYNATGIRPNEEAGEVGLGWALNATGVISRTIRGGDDLFQGTSFNLGYVYNTMPMTYNLGFNWRTNPLPPNGSYYQYVASNRPDTQPDIFNYNFFGYSGSFVLSQKFSGPIQAIKITQDACSISYTEPSQQTVTTSGSFTVITPEGYQGVFSIAERSSTFSMMLNVTNTTVADSSCWLENHIDMTGFKNQSGMFRTTTSWYLSSITSPRGQVITFTYDMNPDGVTSPYLSNTRSFGEVELANANPIPIQTIHEHVYLKNIHSDEVNVDFSMDLRDDIRANVFYTSVASGSVFPVSAPPKRYTSINIKGVDSNSKLNKTITFRQSYFNQGFQDRVSGNQNGTELYYMRSRLDRVSIDDQEYRFYYNNWLPPKTTSGIDHFGFYNGNKITALLPPVAASPSGFLPYQAIVGGDTSYMRAPESYVQRSERWANFNVGKSGLLIKVKYPTRGYTTFTYEPHTYLPDATGYFTEQTSNSNIAGGARISMINDYDYDKRLILSKTYKYVDDPNKPALNQITTGKLMIPLYNRFSKVVHDPNDQAHNYPPIGIDFSRKAFTTIPGNNSAEGKVIGYSKVHEIVNDSINGLNYRNTYYFENRPGKVLPWNSFAVGYPNLNGQAMETRNYNSQGTVVQQTVNQNYYHVIDSIKALTYQYSGSNGYPFVDYAVFYPIKKTFITPYSTVTTVLDQQGTTSEDPSTGNITYNGPTHQTQKKFSYKNYLLSYDRTLNGLGDSVVTQYKRPADYLSPSAALLQMKSVNMVNPVIEEILSKNGAVISANGNRYSYDAPNNKINLASTYAYNRNNVGSFSASTDGNTFSSPYELKTNYTSYDQYGKLHEYTGPDGVIHSFIWGYNNKLPIVHGVGVNYSTLLSAYNATVSTPLTYEVQIRNQPGTSGNQISTYFHNPLVGITKVTDPSQQKKTYEYDTYSRLAVIRDNNGNVLSQNKYHFKTLPKTRIMSISTTGFDFGTFYHCNVPSPETLTISNTGEDDLNVTSLTVPTGFQSSWQGGMIPAGVSVDAIIKFNGSPTAAPGTPYTGQITFASDATNVTSLSATVYANYIQTGTSKTIQLYPNPLLFSSTQVHSTQYVTISNTGNECLTLNGSNSGSTGTSLSMTDPDWSVNVPGVVLPPGQTTQMNVFLKDSNPNPQNISINADFNGGTDILQLDILKIFLNASSNSITASSPSATITQTFTITNPGNAALNVTNVAWTNNSKFTVIPTSFTVAPNSSQTQTITVTYTASDFSAQSTVLTFTSNSTTATGTVTVNATRTPLNQLTLSPTSIIIKPSAQTASSYITNTGNVPATINSVPPTAPSGFAVTYQIFSGGTWVQVNPNSSPVTLQPTGQMQITIGPAVSGDFSSATGQLNIFDSLNNQYILNLTKSPTP
jgi:YD repeat-containing protein